MHPQSASLLGKIGSFIKRKTSQKYNFNLQYEAKKWDGLSDLRELSRYSIITGFSRYFFTTPRILDLGCGEGVLQQKFTPADYSYFLGVDFSNVAIETAKKNADEKTEFVTGDLNKLQVSGLYDVIIYNESLYYLSHPKAAVAALFPHLSPGGIFIISMVDKNGKERENIWNDIGTLLDAQEKTKTINNAGDSWTVKVYKLKQ